MGRWKSLVTTCSRDEWRMIDVFERGQQLRDDASRNGMVECACWMKQAIRKTTNRHQKRLMEIKENETMINEIASWDRISMIQMFDDESVWRSNEEMLKKKIHNTELLFDMCVLRNALDNIRLNHQTSRLH